MRYFIISNLRASKVGFCNLFAGKHRPTKDDGFIFMNTAYPLTLGIKQFDSFPNKTLYIRWDGDHSKYFKCLVPHSNFEMVHYVYGPKGDEELLTRPYGYPDGYVPSTGYIVYDLMKGPADLYLVNFIGPARDKKKHYKGHAWDYEMRKYKEDKSLTMIEAI